AMRAPYPVEWIHGGGFGTRVGIVGASRIGRRLLRLLESFEFDVVVSDPCLDAQEAARLGARLVGLDELFATSSVVSLHAPLLDDTREMVGRDQLGLLKDGSVLVNTARGALIDQDALVA